MKTDPRKSITRATSSLAGCCVASPTVQAYRAKTARANRREDFAHGGPSPSQAHGQLEGSMLAPEPEATHSARVDNARLAGPEFVGRSCPRTK